MSVNEAAQHFGISKEAIHNRVRRGTLEVKMIDGVKMVLVDIETLNTPSKEKVQKEKKLQMLPSEHYYKFLEEQNAKLQERVEKLEGETRSLRDQKEQMLIAEREKIETIYKEKDEQLKHILASLSKQFILPTYTVEPQEELETFDVEFKESSDAKIIPLKNFIKSLNLSEKKAKELKKRFKKIAKIDSRVITIDKKTYLDTLRYDYSDLL